MFKQPISKDSLFTIAFGILFIGIALSGWLPTSCPLTRKLLQSCPHSPSVYILTSEQKRLAVYPHDSVRSNFAEFSTKSQEKRNSTQVYFPYYLTQSSKTVAILQVKKAEGYTDIALITHPLLQSLKWPSVSTPDVRLYQQNETFTSLSDFKNSLPPTQLLAADTAAARFFGLSAKQFTPLETLTSLTGISYILTTFSPPEHDRGWSLFTMRFDITDAVVTDNKISWGMLFLAGVSKTEPFQLGPLHIDYTQRR